MTRPRGWKERVGSGGAGYDPEKVQPATRGEVYPLFAAGVVLAFFALLVCYRRGYLLLYGDAVAHLAIARRILDALHPGIAELGGVWLPLPHLLMLPFIRNMTMWQTGMAAAPMSMLSYALSVAGVWRLSRRMMRLHWAFAATAFYALNANLLYLATTAMTEALFLMLLVWSVVATMEGVAALRAGKVGDWNGFHALRRMDCGRGGVGMPGMGNVGDERGSSAEDAGGVPDFYGDVCGGAVGVVLVQPALYA